MPDDREKLTRRYFELMRDITWKQDLVGASPGSGMNDRYRRDRHGKSIRLQTGLGFGARVDTRDDEISEHRRH